METVDPYAEWNTEIVDPVSNDEDLEWVNEADREAKAIVMAIEEARARGDKVQDPEARSDDSESDDEDYMGEGEVKDGNEDEYALEFSLK